MVLSLVMLSLAVTGCGDMSAPYFAKSPPDPLAGVVQTGALASPSPSGPLARRGPVARPNRTLTPGVVASHDMATVCAQSRVRPPIPAEVGKAVFAAYGIPYKEHLTRYGLDYLVPVPLGGAPVPANIWPVWKHRGVGLSQKEALNAKLRLLVCRGDLSLAKVQQDLVTDWYVLWLEYGGR